ncbi:RICIN domain-containing protein [Lentzea sp. NPDC006480]|uniref:RICIN domain-containing protein n=1 Tax=Lentzea sp. NPDC006480 TaxID=3157176 RepID=UPI0033A3140F
MFRSSGWRRASGVLAAMSFMVISAGAPSASALPRSDEYPMFKSLHGGMCVDVNMNDHNTWSRLTVWDCNGGDNQRWSGGFMAGGNIQNLGNQKCMDAADPNNDDTGPNGNDVGTFPCKQAATHNQAFFWRGTDAGLGYGPIETPFAGRKCLEIRVNPANPYAVPPRGTPVQLWDCNGSPWQQWKLFKFSSK